MFIGIYVIIRHIPYIQIMFSHRYVKEMLASWEIFHVPLKSNDNSLMNLQVNISKACLELTIAQNQCILMLNLH